MKEFLKTVGACLAVLSVLALIFGIWVWNWNECRGVGHGIVYCIIR